MSLIRRFINLFRARQVTEDIDRELTFHVQERADELVSQGMSEADAMREAKRRLGNEVYQRERARDASLLTSVESMAMDVRYALRSLASSRGFAVVAVLSLALGIGANTAIFSLINAVMLKELPVRDPSALVRVHMKDESSDVFTNPLWEAIRDREDVFDGVFAYGDNTFDLAEGGEVRPVDAALVSGAFFSTLGVRPKAGRMLTVADDFRGCPGGAVLSERLSAREFGGAAQAVGRTISLQGHRFPVVGVVPAAFFGVTVGKTVDVYVPLCAEAVISGEESNLDRRSTWWLRIMGRPLPTVSAEQLNARLATIARPVYEATVPEHWGPSEQKDYLTQRTLGSVPSGGGVSYLRSEYSKSLVALMVIVGLVLMIACANVANLLLARATARQREMAVRLAIGSGRMRLIRQLLTESLLLSTFGAVLGILFARWGSALLVRFLSTRANSVYLDLALDNRVLGFTIAVATFTGVLFGLAPAWQSARVEPQTVLKAQGRSVIEGQSKFSLGKGLVVAQMALSLVLVMGAALLLGTFRSLTTQELGLKPEGVLLVQMDLTNAKIADEQQRAVYLDLLSRVRSIPGVGNAAGAMIMPLSGSSWNDVIMVNGFKPAKITDALGWMNEVSEDFFATMGTRMVAGRDFNRDDVPGSTKVAIVNETFARKYFGAVNVLGREFSTQVNEQPGPPFRIVGIVEDAAYGDIRDAHVPVAYVARNQAEQIRPWHQIALRTSGDAAALVPAMKRLATEVSPAATLQFVTMDRQIADTLTRERLLATLSGFFGVLALLLAMIGLYGIMSYNVARRRGEIGIRMALGSERRGVMQMVLREVGGMVVAGILLGGIAIYLGRELLSSFLYNMKATDPAMLALSALTLGAVALTAGAIPAWRAGRVDPMEALRQE